MKPFRNRVPSLVWTIIVALFLGGAEGIHLVSLESLSRFPVFQDGIQAVAGQRYFLNDVWHWPLLDTKFLFAPKGASVAMTDSTPLLLLLLKPFVPLLPVGFVPYRLWLIFCFVMQAVSAVLALAAAGERRVLALIAGAVMALSMPFFLGRIIHFSLMGQFLILLAFAFYFSLVHGKKWALILTPFFLGTCLLIHPILMLLAFGTIASSFLTLLWMRRKEWRAVACTCAGSAALIFVISKMLGYFHYTQGAGGYGLFSMNFLSPVWPMHSDLLRHFPALHYGLQTQSFEGYVYLGGGLLALLICDLVFCRQRLLNAAKRHAGLSFFLSLMTLYAISNTGYAGPYKLWHISLMPPLADIFRSSGRCFWPVGYGLLIAAIRSSRAFSRPVGSAVLVLCALLQFLDTRSLRAQARDLWNADFPVTPDTLVLTGLITSSRQVAVYPVSGCGLDLYGPDADRIMTVFRLSAEQGRPINTFYLSRTPKGLLCDHEMPPTEQQPGTLEVYVGGFQPAQGRRCQNVSGMKICPSR
ncbi:DUF6311 domain-containing protein [Gluconobacter japonicus]|uniref:DUF6311 domain-containing protein n=1 Tax=Gluconobacter japonicus TaxID=376620 RepID=UPI000785307A|nr:DUF6311 domain-containing protein [Gluconobacter japonicus]KXV26511.1 hypothetical protein AD937_07070 [Gluconobacter japonicus]